LAEVLKYTFAVLLKEREDLAFFDQRIEKGLVAKLEGIVDSEFAHMDYDEAIGVLERAPICNARALSGREITQKSRSS